MIAAIYARKSNEQNDRSKEDTSCARQIAHARQFAVEKGWTVVDEYVFEDDGIGGAEFAKRPGFLRLLNSLKPHPPFQVLVMSEGSRLGREQIETAYALKQIITAGVQVWTYLDKRQRTLGTPVERAVMAVEGMADEIERDKARQRVTDALVQRARAGHSCGPAPFGYVNVPVVGADGKRSHVKLQVNPAEAAIVQRIFRESANGTGFARLAKLLNREHAPAPKPKRRRAPGWSASTVRVILNRRKYLGDGLWNQTEKRDAWGQKKLRRRPETDWIQVATPPIITPEEWQAVHQRLDGVRAQLQAVGAAVGNRRARDLDSKYLLSGFARCKVCGGSLGALGGGRSSAHGRVYGCLRFHKTGQCGNGLRVEMSRVDTAVLNAIVDQVLADHVVTAIVEGVMARLAPTVVSSNVAELRTALHGIDREIGALTRAIAMGGELESLLVELRACEKRRDDLRLAIDARARVQGQRIDRAALEKAVRARVDDWQALLTRRAMHGRQLLREMLAAPIQFTPIKGRRAYSFEGEASFGGVIAGEAGVPTLMVPLRGFEPRSRG